MVDARPRVVFVSEGQEITHRQMEALAALHEKGSMRKAAEAIGVSTPVLHKYVREIEVKAEANLITSTSKGSRLTEAGLELLRRFRAYELRLKDEDVLRVAGTVVTERCLLSAATELSDNGIACHVTISTDEMNMRLMDEMRLDCVILDDAIFAMEKAQDIQSTEIGSDMLLLKETGSRYARLGFGAQRLAFRYLDEKGIPHDVVRTIYEPTMVDRTDLSYFVNKSLVRNAIVRADGAKDQKWSIHSVIALQCSENENISAFLEEAREAWLYRKG
ncbi:MAG: LysR family transcriptional regulator [Thermoplasmatota archaeon]|nr:LysR family transcriptional regulator [Candidatus Thermoplasmatota archaeon]MBU1914054.1 LysR family transcriptional regulator [Candidatus Thermoplasmatota archaeon]